MHPEFVGPCTLHPAATEIALYVLLTLLVSYILFSAFPLFMACEGARDRREAKRESRQMACDLEREGEGVELKSFHKRPSASRFFVETVVEKTVVEKNKPVETQASKEIPTIIIEGEGVDKATDDSTADAGATGDKEEEVEKKV